MKTYSSKSTLLALAAILALAGSLHITSDAAPVNNDLSVNDVIGHVANRDFIARQDRDDIFVVHLEKRPAPDPSPDPPNPRPPATSTGGNPRPPATSANPTPTRNPNPNPNPNPGPPNPNPNPNPPRTQTSTAGTGPTQASQSRAATSSSSHTSSGSSPTSANQAEPPAPTDGAAPDGTVPTGVSQKVFIGLGTVGGFFVFALGGLAFCRHRKKKNLASALLQQTAQFNNNNPYAKLPEPATPKEVLPMTPTKPIGTYNVVATYTPALADEIEIGLGDSVTILQEFDDGWCMGVNNSRNGIKGVFPRHCVEMGPYEGSQHGAPGGPHYPPSPSFKATANKRMSSIAPPQGWNDGYNNGYHNNANYPPQPSPHLMAHPQQGGGGGGYYNGGGY
ncbi:hypothetical protein BGZ94_009657 [Podila epigama]|nr:hypothetical protein BGZ94_009657 [Podila epigama]